MLNWKQTFVLAGTLAFGAVQAHEDVMPDTKPVVENPQPTSPAATTANPVPGMGRRGVVQMFGQNQTPEQRLARMSGIDLDDTKSEAHIDGLPFGIQSRFVKDVPVGGVDSFQSSTFPMGASTPAWKVEQLYKLTPEQFNALEALRGEYKKEIKMAEDELLVQQKAIAAKIKDLRLKYESRSNDVLTGADKENKQKIDALEQDTYTQNAKMLAEAVEQNKETKDMAVLFGISKDLREKATANTTAACRKMEELVSPEGKALIEQALKTAAENQAKMQQRGGNNHRGGAVGPDGKPVEPVKPPAPPEKDANF